MAKQPKRVQKWAGDLAATHGVEDAVKLVKKTTGTTIDVRNLPLDDAQTFALLQRGDTKGVFQFESDGIRELLKRMRPDHIRDAL